jgi:protein TonB
MVESTVRRERIPVPLVASPAYLWEVPQKPVAVRLPFDVIDRLEHEVLENFRSLTSRGSEIGGLLLGSASPGNPLVVCVDDFEAIPCDYTRGPLYRLGDTDLGRFERAMEKHAEKGEAPIAGFFRSHTRKALSFDEEDLAFFEARFPEAHHIALLVRPFATKASVAGIFIREDGRVRGDASYLEFPFRSAQLTPTGRVIVPATEPQPAPPAAPKSATPTRPSARAQIVPIPVRLAPHPVDAPVPAPADDRPVAPAAPPVESVAQPAAPTVTDPRPAASKTATGEHAAPTVTESRPAAPKTATGEHAAPTVTESHPAPAAQEPEAVPEPAPHVSAPAATPERQEFAGFSELSTSNSRGSRVVLLALGLLVAVLVGVGLFVYPGFLVHSRHETAVVADNSPLTLRVEPTGTDLLLTWNKNSNAIRNASKGALSITDGDRHEDYPMGPNELLTGSIVYSPISPDVSFHMEVIGADQSKTVTESVRSLRPVRPSPMPETNATQHPAGTQPAAAVPVEGTPAPGAETAAAPGAEAPKPVTPVKAFNVASLSQRLRAANPTEVANLVSAAPTETAVPRINSDLPAAFASSALAPPPVAPPAKPAGAAAGKTAVSTGGVIKQAELVYHKDPDYPALARQMGAKGTVIVMAVIGTDGRVIKATAIQGHPLLRKAAEDAVRKWVYKPTLLNGVPVQNESRIILTFQGQ